MKGKSSTETKTTKKPKTRSKAGLVEEPVRKIHRKIRDRKFLDLEYRYKNNLEEWFAILLRDDCDLCESYKLLQYEIEEVFGDKVEYFLPVYVEPVGKKQIGIVLFDGYIFIKKTDSIMPECFTKRTECLEGILMGTQQQRPVNNRDINRFKTKLIHELDKRIPKKGDMISAYEGTFKNMAGKVLSINKKNLTACVEFRKKTRVVEAVLSVVNFEIVKG